MKSRLELQTLLETTLGSENVYFQPPESIQLKYPCIIYKLSRISSNFADDRPYKLDNRYELMFITKNPDSSMRHALAELPRCSFDRFYTSESLNHYVYNIYF